MKRLITSGLLLILAIAVFTNCTKKKDSTNKGSASATAGGTAWTATAAAASYEQPDSLFELITGNTSGIALDVVFHGFTGTMGTFSQVEPVASGYTNAAGLHTISSGSITVNSISTNNIAGTFNFMTDDSIAITNGAFNAPLVVE